MRHFYLRNALRSRGHAALLQLVIPQLHVHVFFNALIGWSYSAFQKHGNSEVKKSNRLAAVCNLGKPSQEASQGADIYLNEFKRLGFCLVIGSFRSVLCVSFSSVVTVMIDSSENTNRTGLLRAVVSKYRESGTRSKDFFISPKKPYSKVPAQLRFCEKFESLKSA